MDRAHTQTHGEEHTHRAAHIQTRTQTTCWPKPFCLKRLQRVHRPLLVCVLGLMPLSHIHLFAHLSSFDGVARKLRGRGLVCFFMQPVPLHKLPGIDCFLELSSFSDFRCMTVGDVKAHNAQDTSFLADTLPGSQTYSPKATTPDDAQPQLAPNPTREGEGAERDDYSSQVLEKPPKRKQD